MKLKNTTFEVENNVYKAILGNSKKLKTNQKKKVRHKIKNNKKNKIPCPK